MAIELIKISEFPQVSEPGDWIVVSDAAGTGYKISKEDFKEWLGTVTVIADKPIALADPAPTMDGTYIPTEPGTYTNAGGLVYDPDVVDAGKYVQFIKNDTVWTKLAVDLPQAENKIPDWESGTYNQGDQVIHNGQIWSVNVASTTEEPGAGLAWTPDLAMIQESDLTIEQSINLARPENLLENFYIGSSGNKSSGAGWWTYRVFCNAGDYVTFGNFNIDTGGNLAFYPADDNPANTGTAIGLVQFAGSYTNGALPKTLQAPLTEPTVLYIPVARPSNSPEDWAKVMINFGQELMPYVPSGRVTRIKGYSLESEGEAYDQSLNTTNDVKFESVEAAVIATALTVDIPEGSGVPPAGVELGDAWIDTTDNTIKVRRA